MRAILALTTRILGFDRSERQLQTTGESIALGLITVRDQPYRQLHVRLLASVWTDGRVVEGARLESV
jgi:hypothetical protein